VADLVVDDSVEVGSDDEDDFHEVDEQEINSRCIVSYFIYYIYVLFFILL